MFMLWFYEGSIKTACDHDEGFWCVYYTVGGDQTRDSTHPRVWTQKLSHMAWSQICHQEIQVTCCSSMSVVCRGRVHFYGLFSLNTLKHRESRWTPHELIHHITCWEAEKQMSSCWTNYCGTLTLYLTKTAHRVPPFQTENKSRYLSFICTLLDHFRSFYCGIFWQGFT